jgi:indoleamine 2,3-dioxygenase
MAALADLAAFDLSPERGFLPERDPLCALPARFTPWEELAHELPRLIPSGRLRRLLCTMPLLCADELSSAAEQRRAMTLLSYLAHAHVWCEDPPAQRIPRAVAEPWTRVADRLGRPPVLSYASYALDNWRRFDAAEPIALGNLALQQNFLGGVDEDWFILVHVAIESEAVPLVNSVGPALEAVERADSCALGCALHTIAGAIEAMVRVLQRMPENCDPYIYFRRARPFIHGWTNHPALPDGVVYEGVFDDQPRRFRGETGAQSGIVPTLDALLGVSHATDPLRAHLLEMRDYMPPGHRAFLDMLECRSRVRAFVEGCGERDLVCAYDECLQWLHAFRATHLEYAARYIHHQSGGSGSNPAGVGTGGTPFMRYLRKHRDETASQRLGTPRR